MKLKKQRRHLAINEVKNLAKKIPIPGLLVRTLARIEFSSISKMTCSGFLGSTCIWEHQFDI